MKILLATIFDYPHTGGLSTHMTTLKSGLESQGHEVDIISFSEVPGWKRQFLVRGPGFFMNRFSAGKGLLYNSEKRSQLLTTLIRDAHEQKCYDMVNAQDVYATFASIQAGAPVVTTVHGYMTYEAISRGTMKEGSRPARMLLEKEKLAYQQTLQTITVDHRIKEYLKKHAGVDSVKIHNFIDVDQFKPATDQRNNLRKKYGLNEKSFYLFVPRRLTKKNGVIYPVLAMPVILRQVPDVHLVYAGTGEEEIHIRAKAKELGIGHRVHLLGAIPHEQMKEYYAMSDLTLIPSIHSDGVEEATSISALEGMGAGIPVIASSVGGLKEIIDHEVNGLLVKEKDTGELAHAIVRLLQDADFGSRLARKAREKIEQHYSHLSAAKSYVDVYDSVRK